VGGLLSQFLARPFLDTHSWSNCLQKKSPPFCAHYLFIETKDNKEMDRKGISFTETPIARMLSGGACVVGGGFLAYFAYRHHNRVKRLRTYGIRWV